MKMLCSIKTVNITIRHTPGVGAWVRGLLIMCPGMDVSVSVCVIIFCEPNVSRTHASMSLLRVLILYAGSLISFDTFHISVKFFWKICLCGTRTKY